MSNVSNILYNQSRCRRRLQRAFVPANRAKLEDIVDEESRNWAEREERQARGQQRDEHDARGQSAASSSEHSACAGQSFAAASAVLRLHQLPAMARPPPAPASAQPASEAMPGEQDTTAAMLGTGDVADRDEAFGVSLLALTVCVDHAFADCCSRGDLAHPCMQTKTLAQLREEAIQQRRNAME